MKRSHVSLKRLGLVLPMIVVLGSLLITPNVGSISAHDGHAFFSLGFQPIGVAATPDRLLVTSCDGSAIKVWSLDSAGSPSLFATVNTGGCLEPDIAIAPPTPGFVPATPPFFPSSNAAGYFSNFVYVTQPPSTGDQFRIREISLDGTVNLTPVAQVTCAPPNYVNITFDRVGGFGVHGILLITCTTGKVWKKTATGPLTLVADVGEFIEGPDVAPISFSLCPGCLFVGSLSADRVFSVSPTGNVRRRDRWRDANGVDFVPAFKCDYRTSGRTYFSAGDFVLGQILTFPRTAFTGLSGLAALVTKGIGTLGDANGIGKLTSDGRITAFEQFFGNHKRSAFVDCSVATLVITDVEPGQDSNIINLSSGGLVVVVLFGGPNFDTANVVINPPFTPTFGQTGNEQSLHHAAQGRRDNNGDGSLDLELHFRIPKLCSNAPCDPNMQQPAQWVMKGQYIGPSGDPEFESGD